MQKAFDQQIQNEIGSKELKKSLMQFSDYF